MVGGGSNPQGSRYTHNDAAFVEYNTRLQSNNLPTFSSAASKFTEWLSSDKAYYPSARASIVSIVESAHLNVCRIQGDQSVPLKLDKTLPGLDPWYQPYLSLLKQVGSHLNHFEPDHRARLQLLVENAGIKIVQVPTLTENTSPQPKSILPTERVKENPIPADASPQVAGPGNQMQQSGFVPLVSNSEPPKRRRRKLNMAIFDIDTAAALRTKAQAEPSIVEAKNPPCPEVVVQQEATGAVIPPERPTQSKHNEQLPEVTVADSSRTLVEDSQPPEEATVEQPREGSAVNPSQGAGFSNKETSRNHEGHPDRLEAPTADSLPEEAEIGNAAEEPPGPLDLHPETAIGPVVMELRTNSPALESTPEETRVEDGEGPPQQSQAVFGIVEESQRDADSEVPSRPSDDAIIHGVIRRRESNDSVGGERNRTPPEPPAKRIRTELEATTVIAPSMPSSRAATPGALIRSPSGSVTSVPRSLSAIPSVQRSSSDMILESDSEATPTPPSGKEATGEDAIRDDGAPSFKQRPLAETGSEPETKNRTTESHEKQVTQETPMPPVQDLSLTSPETKPNPFAASRIFLRPSGALPPLLRATAIPDVGHLSLYSPAVLDARNRGSAVGSPAPRQESPTRQNYIFSAAEIRTLVASRGSDEGSGPNKLVFSLDWGFMNGIIKWRNFKAGQGPLEGSFCLSLACYPVDSVAPLMNTTMGKQEDFDALIRRARIKSSWPSGPGFHSALKDGSGKSYAIPPFTTTEDNFVDISESALPGENSYTIEDNDQSLSSWLFAVYVHTPTVAYFDAAKTRVDRAQKWVETLKSFAAYNLPPVNWNALQSPDLS